MRVALPSGSATVAPVLGALKATVSIRTWGMSPTGTWASDINVVILSWDPANHGEWEWYRPDRSSFKVLRAFSLAAAIAAAEIPKDDAGILREELADPASLLAALAVMES